MSSDNTTRDFFADLAANHVAEKKEKLKEKNIDLSKYIKIEKI